MNLGQAVAVCLYELTRAGLEGARELPVLHEAPATSADRERLAELLLEVMNSTGYTRRYPHNANQRWWYDSSCNNSARRIARR
jgi:tRNA C32,U32 (ribose-2'-O)-methylase TrmJ